MVPASGEGMAEEAAMSLAGAAELIAPVASDGGAVVAVASEAAVSAAVLFLWQAEAVSAIATTAAAAMRVGRALRPISIS
jgi:hypothetical protein